MSKRFVISENEIREIREMYGLLNEQERVINASTSPEKMSNFPGNQKFGLNGDKTKENFYFKSTLKNLIFASTGDATNYLSSFTPTNDAKQYVDYIKIGDNELTNQGSISFDLRTLPSSTEVIATHNGLLLLRRMMNELGGQKNGKVTLSMSSEVRESGQKNYTISNLSSSINAGFNGLSYVLGVLIVPQQEREKISDGYAVQYLKDKSDDELKSMVLKSMKNITSYYFLAKQDVPQIDTIITDKQFTTAADTSAFETYYGNGLTKDNSSVLNSSWKKLQDELKSIMISNMKLYYPEDFQGLAEEAAEMIKSVYSTDNFKENYSGLFKQSELGSKYPIQQGTKTQSSTSYQLGK
jgi:hypothetical protein